MQLRFNLALILGCNGIAAAAAAQSPPPQPPPVVRNAPVLESLPAVRIHDALTDYNRWLNRVALNDDVAGLATAVVVGDRVAYERTLGYADARSGELVKPTTVFRLASLSKAFATAMTGLLVSSGRLSWDTRLVDVLPFFRLKDLQAEQQATVRDIAGQRLGLPRNSYDLKLEDDVPYEELVRDLDQIDMACDVGECYSYQNVAFSLLGDVIYARTGHFYYHAVEKNLFLPLGMTTATYGRDALENSKSWARPHRRTRGGWLSFEPKVNYYRVAPAAGVNASLRDMEQWLMAQMGGRPDVLPSDLLDVLHAPGINTPGETRASPWRRARLRHAHYALGWRVYDYAGHTMIYHAGAVEGYRAVIAFLPEYRIGMVLMWNCTSPTPSGLPAMLFDRLLGLNPVDWAGLEKTQTRHSSHKSRRKRRH
jgi:beta-lactamase class C